MKKLLSLALVLLLVAQIVIIPATAEETLSVLSTAEYAFNSTDGVNVPADATFTVPTGKTVKTLSLNGETIEEGDGETKWDTFPSAVKNYTYNSATGAFTISRRFIGVEIDLYGARTLDFVLEFTDGTKGILRLKGKYNAKKLSAAPKDYSESYPSGYKAEEVKPTASWQVLSTAARQPAVNLLDGVTNQYHSYYANEGSSIIFRDDVPHYIDIDTGSSTPISGVMYKPRTSGTGGCFTTVIYQGANNYPNFTDIKTVTYAGDLTTKITKFNKNVSYRYYRIKIVTAVSGYGTGDEIHFLKPYFPISDFSVDIAKSFKPTFSTGTFGTSVVSVEVDGKAISSDLYAFSNHSFTFSKDYIKSLAVGNHTMKICLDDSYTDFNVYIENSAKDLSDAITNAKGELLSYVGKDASAYIAEVENATTISAVTEILDRAAAAFGAEIITLPYKHTYSITDGELLHYSVSKEGSEISDTSVVTCESSVVTAVGLGRALLTSNGKFYVIKTTKADIAVVIVSGQSNAAGDSSNYLESPSALGKYKGRYLVTNSMNCSLPMANVTWDEAIYAAEHGGAPSAAFSETSWATKGWSAAEANQLGARLSDEWDMTIWVINTAICARVMDDFDPEKETHKAYTHTVNYTKAVKALIAEDPHYVLDDSKTGFFWLQGCSDGIGTASANTMEEYTDMFMNMYEGWKKEIGIKYAGIWLVRAGVNSNGDKDFYMSGPRLSQHYLGNSAKEEHKNIHLIMNTDIWRTDEGVNDYFTEKYPDAEAFKAYYGYDRPETFADVKPDLHHRQKGYNELGDEAGRVISLIMDGKAEPMVYASLYDFYGNEVTEDGFSLMRNEEAVAVPVVTSTHYNASYGLTVTTADSDIAVFDNDTYTLTGVSEGETTILVKYNNITYASYPVTVEGIQNTILSDRSKWTITTSSVNGSDAGTKMLDGNTATRWVADLSLKNPHHFEITLPEATYISGFSFDPFNNSTSGKIDVAGYPYNYEFYGAETDNGEYHLLKTGTFSSTDVQVSQTVDLSTNIKVKKVKFVYVTSSGSYGAMSEFYLTPEKTLDPSDRSTWVITTSSVQGNNNGSKLVDGKNNTRWVADLTLKDPTPPHSFEIALPSLYTISGFSFDTYYGGDANPDSTGYPRAYEFYGATSDLGEYTLLKAGTFSAEDIRRYTTLELGRNVKVKKVKLVYKSSNGGYGAMSEFYLNSEKDFSCVDVFNQRDYWYITASSVEGTRGNPYNLVDGSTSTSFVADITDKTPPHHFEILLPTEAEVASVGFDSYTDDNGYPLTYEIYTSDTEDGEYVLTKSGSFDRTNDAAALKSQVIDFGKTVTVRKLKFVFTSTVNGYAAMSEFYLYPPAAPPTENVTISTTTATGGTVYIGDKPVGGSESFNQGEEITLKAVPEEGSVFKAWVNAATGKIVSTDDEYTFTAYTNRKILALFADEAESDDVFVSFISKNNQYIYYSYVAKGTDISASAPSAEKMYVSGYSFTGFTPTPSVVTKSTDFRGNYTKNSDLYEITITGGTYGSGKTEVSLAYNSICKVKANPPAAGTVFTGWLLNGVLASYDPEFTFYVFGDATLEATYGASLTATPFVTLLESTKWKNGEYNMVSIVGSSYLPEGNTFVEAGILYVKSETDADTLVLENEGEKVSDKEIKRTSVTENQMFKLSASYKESGLTARGYLIYIDAEGEKQVVYTNINVISDTVSLSGIGIPEAIDMEN